MEDQLLVGILSISNLVSLVVYAILSLKKKKEIQTPASPSHEHLLVRTWIGDDPNKGLSGVHTFYGWRWACSCGVQGIANQSKGNAGNELEAISNFKAHAKGYRLANSDVHVEALKTLQSLFDEYRQKCYCKESNNELILLEDKIKTQALTR